MLTCKETSQILSEIKDHDLPWKKRLLLKMHLMACHRCHKYAKQLKTLYLSFQKLKARIESDPEIRLPENKKEEIKKNLNEQSER